MKNIDEEIANTLDIIGYFKHFELQLNDRNTYIDKLKQQLDELKSITNATDFQDLKKKISEKV